MSLKRFFRFGAPKEGGETRLGKRLLIAVIAAGILVASPLSTPSAQASLFNPSPEGKVNRLFPIPDARDNQKAQEDQGVERLSPNRPRTGYAYKPGGTRDQQAQTNNRTSGSQAQQTQRQSQSQPRQTQRTQRQQQQPVPGYVTNLNNNRLSITVTHLDGSRTTVKPDTSAISRCFRDTRSNHFRKTWRTIQPWQVGEVKFCAAARTAERCYQNIQRGSTLRDALNIYGNTTGARDRYCALRAELTQRQIDIDYKTQKRF